MYRQYRRGLDSVGDVLERSLSNLSIVSNQDSSVAELKQLADLREVTESQRTETPTELSDDEPESEITSIVNECWAKVGSQCVQYGRRGVRKREPDDGSWKSVRIFVSSTFTDFFCEREVLVKKVFPVLRQWCRKRKLYLIDCDLRWGIPKDTTTADTIKACLEELDRCMQETSGQPFFLNMLGEKYGWIPDVEDIPDSVRSKFDWVPNTSITFMEILHGAYRIQNSNALFMLRKGSVLEAVPDRLLTRYKSTEPLDIEHLKHLKTWLQTRFPDQVIEYDSRAEGTVTKHGKEILNIVDLEDFCITVEEFFKDAIQRMYPDRQEVTPQDSRVLAENAEQERYAEELAMSMIGREPEVNSVMGFLKGNTQSLKEEQPGKPFARKAEYWQNLTKEDKLLALYGQSGNGKTTLLAKVSQLASQAGYRVFHHFCGSTGESRSVEMLLQRLVAFLKQDLSPEHLESLYQSSEQELTNNFKELLVSMTTSNADDKLLLIFDGLEQLNSASYLSHLSWLPPSFPACIKCVVSAGNHPPTLSRVNEYAHYSLTIGSLSREDAKMIVELFLGRFNKTLESNQMQMILDSKCSESPLWLYFICEELRIYGDFRSLTSQVEAVTSSVDGVLEAIVRRLITEDDTGHMEKTLCIIACSFGVITALDLRRMLGNVEAKEPLAQLYWSKVQTLLQAFLRVSSFNEQISFMHDKIKQVIYEKVLKPSGKLAQYHQLLSDYLEYWCDDLYLKTEHLPDHLLAANLKQRLVQYIRTSPVVMRMPLYKRSVYIKKCRCRSLADPVIQGVGKAVICQFCAHARAIYHPMNSHINKNMCVVCGNAAISVHDNPAHVCQFHNTMRGTNITKCFLCDKIVAKPENSSVGKLCMHCGFGNDGKTCARLDFR